MNIITPEAILNWVHVFEPWAANPTDDKKYSCTFIFTEDADLSPLKEAVIEVARNQWGGDLEGASVEYLGAPHPFPYLVAGDLRIRLPWRDDDGDVADKGYPEGSTFINARSNNPPGVVSNIQDPHNDGKPAKIVNATGDVQLSNGDVLPAQQEVYSGAIGRGLLSVYEYTQPNTGVSLGLSGVQVLRDGERLDGRANPQDEFDAAMDATADLSDLTGEGGGDEDDLDDLIG